jgi:hypothetical protein
VDRAMSVATMLARVDRRRAEHYLRGADGLLAALDSCAPLPLPQPRLFPVDWHGDNVQLEVKSSCCLFYKTVSACDRTTDNYCTGCPLLPDAVRQPRWARWLDEVQPPVRTLTAAG